jgi:hypothetical protein
MSTKPKQLSGHQKRKIREKKILNLKKPNDRWMHL